MDYLSVTPKTAAARESLVLEGECYLVECEGGFTAPWVVVDNEPIDRALLLWTFGDLPVGDRGGSVDEDKATIGQVRITIERIDDNG